MATTITGVAADFNHAVTYTLLAPASGNPLTAASVISNGTTPKTGFQNHANAIEYFRVNAAILGLPNTFTQQTTLNGGWQNTNTPTHLYERLWSGVQGSKRTHVYAGNGAMIFTVNASWDDAGQVWSCDAVGSAATCERYTDGARSSQYHAATAQTWGDTTNGGTSTTTWLNREILDYTTGDLSVGRDLAVTRDLSVTTGDVGVVAGDVNVGAGSVVTLGDPASDQARLKGKQLIMSGSAPGVTGGVAAGLVPATPTLDTGSCDAAGGISVTPAAGAVSGVLVTVAYDKSYPNHAWPVISASTLSSLQASIWVSSYDKDGFVVSASIPSVGTPTSFTYAVIGN